MREFGTGGAGTMRRTSIRRYHCAFAVMVVLSGCGPSTDGGETSKINGSVHVPAGQPAAAAETINGSVHIDENAAVTTATTVNGSVRMGPHATAVSLNTVNGAISLDNDAHVSGSATSVNGDLTVGDGAEIVGSLTNVNGKITLTAAHVAGGIRTVSGSISILGASHVEGGILVERASGDLLRLGDGVPRVVIGPGATVAGELRFERKVDLYVSDKATIGPVSGATPIPFSGDAPPS
jgi:DUF4097 and DUF4098 domain-containing protein YvlB